MTNWNLYRILIHFLPKKGKINETTLPESMAKKAEKILRAHRCMGASIALFDEREITGMLAFGAARKNGEMARKNTIYRAASVSKFITALGAMKLHEEGKIDLDADVARFFPHSLRHPKAPDTAITLRMLLSHTAGIHDGDRYNNGIAKGMPLSEILQGDSFCAHLPHEKWEYSNLGAGIGGAVTEAAAGQDFEMLMQETVFSPLNVQATYYPQKAQAVQNVYHR